MGDDRRKVSLNILGTKVSFKLPKVKMFKKKKDNEPEWSWQAVHVAKHQTTKRYETLKHRFLTRDQVDTIHSWLSQVPLHASDDQSLLLQDDPNVSNLSGWSGNYSQTEHNSSRTPVLQSIHTEIF